MFFSKGMEEISAGDTKNEFLCICARLKLFLMADSIVKNHSKKKKKGDSIVKRH